MWSLLLLFCLKCLPAVYLHASLSHYLSVTLLSLFKFPQPPLCCHSVPLPFITIFSHSANHHLTYCLLYLFPCGTFGPVQTSIRHLVYAVRSLKSGPIQNINGHIWSMPDGFGQDRISRTVWHRPDISIYVLFRTQCLLIHLFYFWFPTLFQCNLPEKINCCPF